MGSLESDLRIQKREISEFRDITVRVLEYLPHVITGEAEVRGYKIHSSTIANSLKYIRPINQRLFIYDKDVFLQKFEKFQTLLKLLKSRKDVSDIADHDLIDSVLYTVQQAVGAGFDLLVSPNSARKHVGNRFEELMRVIFSEIGIANRRLILNIPYSTQDGEKLYKCENDLILSPHQQVKSSTSSLDRREIVVGVKTSSKDRMGKMFIDKMLLQNFVKHEQKVIGIFLNDVQRKESNNIGFTIVSGLFMVYTRFLTPLQGVYYLDPPPISQKAPFNRHIKPFSQLITEDIWKLLSA